MLSDLDELHLDVLNVTPILQNIVRNFQTSLRTASAVIAEQEERITVLDRRDYIAQMLLIGGSTLAYLLGLWSGGSVCPK
jgi:hypothetical protein